MARGKNYAGTRYYDNQKYNDRQLDKIDRRELSGKFNEDGDQNVRNRMTIKDDGSRSWSF